VPGSIGVGPRSRNFDSDKDANPAVERETKMKSKGLILAGIIAAFALPAFGEKTLVAPVPEGGADLIYLLLAGASCVGAIFHSRNQRSKR